MNSINLTDASLSPYKEMTQNSDWQPPIPIDEQSTTAEYPLDALPTLIRNAVSAYHCYGQQPIPLIASSALANISLACQAHANVARDHYLESIKKCGAILSR